MNRFDIFSFYKERPVLVTGGTGFIGTHLVSKLKQLQAQVTLFNGDITQTNNFNMVRGKKVLFHLAGRSGAVNSNTYPLRDLDVNCKGTLVLLEACRKLAPDIRIVFPSSRLVYGPSTQLPVSEEQETKPNSIYGIHKRVVEDYMRFYWQSYQISTVSLRITNPYGYFFNQKAKSYGILNIFFRRAISNQIIQLYGDGSQLRDFIYIDDLIEALLCAGKNEVTSSGEVFNVSSGVGISLLSAAELIISIVGKGRIEHVPWPNDAKLVETGDFVADISKIKSMLEWVPQTSLDEGLQKTLSKISQDKNFYA